MSAPLLTIAVPFYSGVEYLRRALDSIFAQPESAWTVMIVDNSSTEHDRGAAQALAKNYPLDRMRYMRNEAHISACENFNRCIELSSTDLVSTVHGDDEVLPRYAQELLRLAAENPEAAVLFTAVRIIDDRSAPCFSFIDWIKGFLAPSGRGDLVLTGEGSLRSIARGDWINGAAVCYRKSRLGDLRWDPRYPMASDLELWSRVLLSGRTMAGTRRPPVYQYRRHAGQTTAKLGENLERFYEESMVLDLIAERASARGWSSAADVARSKSLLQLHLLFLMTHDIAKGSLSRARLAMHAFGRIRRGNGKGDHGGPADQSRSTPKAATKPPRRGPRT